MCDKHRDRMSEEKLPLLIAIAMTCKWKVDFLAAHVVFDKNIHQGVFETGFFVTCAVRGSAR